MPISTLMLSVVVGASATSFASADLLRGQSISYDPPASLTGLTGSYAATGLPVGCTIDTTTGEITGKPMCFQPRQTVTVTRGPGNATATWGVKYSDFDDPPGFYVPNFDCTAVTAWDTDVTVSTSAALSTAIQNAANNTGSAGAPKFHRITYTGPDITGTFLNGDASAANAGRDYTFTLVQGAGQEIEQLRYGYKQMQVTFRNFLISSLAGSGAGVESAIYGANSYLTLRGCKVGPWWTKDLPTASSNPLIRASDGLGLCLEACHLAGWLYPGIVETRAKALYDVDTIFSHGGADSVRFFSYGGAGSGAKSWSTGRSFFSQINPFSTNHPDQGQTGAQTSSGYDDVIEHYGYYGIQDDARYGSTGFRLQNENGNSPATSRLRYRHAVVALSGWDAIAAQTNGLKLDDYIAVPAPGVGAFGCRVSLNGASGLSIPGDSTLNNLITSALNYTGGWAGNDLTVTGSNISYSNNSQASIEAAFPNISGAVVAQVRHGNVTSPGNIYIPDEVDFHAHPASFRAMVATTFQPAAGWMDKVASDFPTMSDWGSAPATAKPVLSGASLNATTINVSTTGGDGWLFWEVSGQSTTPSKAAIRHGAQRDGGFTGATDAGSATSTVQAWGRTRVTGAGAQSISLGVTLTAGTRYAHLYHERLDGAVSLIATISATI